MKNRSQKFTFKLFTTLVLSVAALVGCEKQIVTDNEKDSFDVTNEIFRVITNSDVRYDVSVLEIFPNTLTGDTITNVNSRGTTDVNYGFAPKKGSRLVVKVSGVGAKTLNCTIAYKGIRLGADNVKAIGNSLFIDFEYVIND